MLRTVAILVGAAFCVASVSHRLAYLQAFRAAPKLSRCLPLVVRLQSHHSRRSFHQRPIRLTVLFGSVRRNYGL